MINLKNWDFLRVLRLVLGIAGLVAAAMSFQLIYLLIGALMLMQAILNTGCGIGGCSVPTYRKHTDTQQPTETTYTEIK